MTAYDATSPTRNQVTRSTYTYDKHWREATITDARSGAITLYYNALDQVTNSIAPAASSAEARQATLTYFDSLGRATNSVLPDLTSVRTEYYPSGLLKRQSGSRQYPVEYTYDSQGRVRTMTTWTNFWSGTSPAGAASTRWNYQSQRGWLASKDYAVAATGALPQQEGTTGPQYQYTSAGRLYQRTWLRGTTTTYGYNGGKLETVTYSDGTPGVTTTHDRLGRRRTVTQANGQTIVDAVMFAHDDAGQMRIENHTNGILSGLVVSNAFNNQLQRYALGLLGLSSGSYSVGYGYDLAGRLDTVAHGGSQAAYDYVANSMLVSQVVFTHGGTTMTTSKQYDYLNRLQSVASSVSGSAALPLGAAYRYNSANQRTRATQPDNAFWVYTYDKLGQVTSGRKYWPDGTPVAGQQFEYLFDEIGNRLRTGVGGETTGGSLRYADYQANRLNQYETRDVPGYVDVTGIANPTATVTVEGNAANRQGEYFHYALRTPNTSAPWYDQVDVTSTYPPGQLESGSVFVPRTPESFTHDVDGNLLSDGRWDYTWDGENRLIRMVARTAVGPQQRLEFAYDWQDRRIAKVVWNNTAGTGTPAVDQRFLYDQWNLIVVAVEVESQFQLAQAFVWGTDLSGSMQGAGGVGGLLKVSQVGQSTTNCFAAFDGNGNVVGLVDVSSGAVLARYEYGPFGELVRATGPMARANPFQFSTKYQDNETGLLYYGYRYYDPRTARWTSRDPLCEVAGENLYAFCSNVGPNGFDYLGLEGCGEAVGKRSKKGQPLYVFTEPNGKWKGTIILEEKGGSAQTQAIQRIRVRWEAKVSVLCNCPCGIRKGTRVYDDSVDGAWLIYDPASLPMGGPPVISSIRSGIGKVIGKAIQKIIGNQTAVADQSTIDEMIKIINSFPVPSSPYAGEWKGRKSPCDK